MKKIRHDDALFGMALRLCYVVMFFLTCATGVAYGQLPAGFVQKKLTGNVINEATSMAHAADGRIFIAERSGAVKVFRDGNVSTVHTVITTTASEQGLLGITLHPQFASNGKCYLFYTNQEKTRHYLDVISISSANTVSSVTRVMQFDSILNGNHNGGALLFKGGLLYIALGESNRAEYATDVNSYRGKILRLQEDGQPAPGNPFYNETGASRQKRSIWGLGLRNPWRMSLDPVSQRLFVIDVGGEFEEINDLTRPDAAKNFNYGWDNNGRSGNKQAVNTIESVYFYPHEANACAITTGVFFNPPATDYPAQYRNRFFFSDWCTGWFRSVDATNPGAGATQFAASGFGSILGTSIGNDGNIYYLNYNTNGSLWRLEYNNNQAPAIVNQPVSKTVVAGDPVSFSVVASGGTPFTYQWQKNGVNITGATDNTYVLPKTTEANAGSFRCVVTNGTGTVTSAMAVLTVQPFNARPVPRILTLLSSLTWSVFDQVSFSGSATDAEDGVLPTSAYKWELRFFHKDNGSEHWHPGPTLPAGVKTGDFIADNNGESSPNIWFRLLLTVTDANGRTGKDSVDIFPNKVVLTAQANVPGLKVVMGTQVATPFSGTFVVNSLFALEATSPQTLGNNVYEFTSWQHGGNPAQSLRVPAINTTYTANYKVAGSIQNPFSGTPVSLPGKIEAEDFDKGGEGIAYHDVSMGNSGSAYRKMEDVDLEGCSEGGFNTGYTADGEWLEYTVNITTAGKYTLAARVSTPGTGKSFHIELDGENISGNIAVPVTGGFQNWQTVSVTTPALIAGIKTLRIVMDAADFNINYLTFSSIAGSNPTVNISSPVNNSSFFERTDITITSNASDVDGSVSKVEFFQGAIKLGEDLTSPFEYKWLAVPVGTYSLTVKATDNAGLTTVSSPVTITVNPVVVNQNVPFYGTPISLPGKIEAEDFDKGGEGIAYHDLSTGNAGKDYRATENVDIEGCNEGGFNIGYVATGEWLEYTVNITAAGKYTLAARVATPGTGKTFHVELDGQNISGSVAVPATGGFQAWKTVSVLTPELTAGVKILRIVMDSADLNFNYLTFTSAARVSPLVEISSPLNGSTFSALADITINAAVSSEAGTTNRVEFFQGETKLGEDNESPFQYIWKAAAAGTYAITAKVTGSDGSSAVSSPVSIIVNKTVAAGKSIPGRIEAEEYDAMNGVQTEGTIDTGGGNNIGWVDSGEWLEYQVNVLKTGIYQISFRVASTPGNAQLQLLSGTTNLTNLTINATGGWQTWVTATATVNLTAGPQTLRINTNTGNWNLNWFEFQELAMARFGVKENNTSEENLFTVYPNPVTRMLTVAGIQDNAVVNIISSSNGRVTKVISQNGTVDVNRLLPGIYVLEFMNGNKIVRRKFIKI